VANFIKNFGIGIYSWKKECWKCKKETPVFSYYLCHDLSFADDYFIDFHGIGIGDLPSSIDKMLCDKYPTIKYDFNKACALNHCIHCGVLQGRNYVVDDPHEIFDDLLHDRNMKKYLIERICIENSSSLLNDLKNLF
jgi:hypothetical protein